MKVKHFLFTQIPLLLILSLYFRLISKGKQRRFKRSNSSICSEIYKMSVPDEFLEWADKNGLGRAFD